MILTYTEAKALVKDHGVSKYRGSKLVLLAKLVNGLYTDNKTEDVSLKTVERRVKTLQGWLAGISDRQLRTVIQGVEELRVVTRKRGVIVFAFDLEKLKSAEKTTVKAKRTLKQRATDRATKAREQYATKRKATSARIVSKILGTFAAVVFPYDTTVPVASAPCAPPKAAPRRGPIKVAQVSA
jgi:hypothetical protein